MKNLARTNLFENSSSVCQSFKLLNHNYQKAANKILWGTIF